MDEIRCGRRQNNTGRTIQADEWYRIAGASATIYCRDCAIEVFGKGWWMSPHADIALSNPTLTYGSRQVTWEERKPLAEAVANYLITAA